MHVSHRLGLRKQSWKANIANGECGDILITVHDLLGGCLLVAVVVQIHVGWSN